MRKIMLIQWLQFRHKLWKYRQLQNNYKIKTLEFDAREFLSIGRFIARFVGELKKLNKYILSAVVYPRDIL